MSNLLGVWNLAAPGAPKHIVKMVVNSSEQGYSVVQIEAIV